MSVDMSTLRLVCCSGILTFCVGISVYMIRILRKQDRDAVEVRRVTSRGLAEPSSELGKTRTDHLIPVEGVLSGPRHANRRKQHVA